MIVVFLCFTKKSQIFIPCVRHTTIINNIPVLLLGPGFRPIFIHSFIIIMIIINGMLLVILLLCPAPPIRA